MRRTEKAKQFATYLSERYPGAICSLIHQNPFQLLVSTILSAQCTDARVNIVTKDLFQKYQTVNDFADADLEALMTDIKSTGFYKNKAKSLHKMANQLLVNHEGEVPDIMEELIKLGGVGRKTANVILGNCFGVYGIVVDTHMKRITHRIGLTKETEPVKVEFDLMKVVPKQFWKDFSHQVIDFGREICDARKPKCELCGMTEICRYYKAKRR